MCSSDLIKVTAEEAQGKVTRWLRDEVSMLIYEEKPDLVFRQHPLWLVPAVIAFPSTGPAGNVGAIEVDAETGEMNTRLNVKPKSKRGQMGLLKTSSLQVKRIA